MFEHEERDFGRSTLWANDLCSRFRPDKDRTPLRSLQKRRCHEHRHGNANLGKDQDRTIASTHDRLVNRCNSGSKDWTRGSRACALVCFASLGHKKGAFLCLSLRLAIRPPCEAQLLLKEQVPLEALSLPKQTSGSRPERTAPWRSTPIPEGRFRCDVRHHR